MIRKSRKQNYFLYEQLAIITPRFQSENHEQIPFESVENPKTRYARYARVEAIKKIIISHKCKCKYYNITFRTRDIYFVGSSVLFISIYMLVSIIKRENESSTYAERERFHSNAYHDRVSRDNNANARSVSRASSPLTASNNKDLV